VIQLALMRHGITRWNTQRRIQGRTDIPLDPEAETELSTVELPERWAQSHVVASPLVRATRTAEILTGRHPQQEPALIEMDWGQWEGRRGVDIYAEPNSGFRHIEQWGWDYHAPGGESPDDVRQRVEPWALALKQDTLAICHIGVMRAVLAVAHGWNFLGSPPFSVKRNRLYIVQIGDKITLGDPASIRLAKTGAD